MREGVTGYRRFVLILFTSTDKRNHKNIILKSTRSLFLYYYIYLCFWAMSNEAKHELQFSGLRKSQRRESVTRYQKFVLILFTCSDKRKTQNDFIKNNSKFVLILLHISIFNQTFKIRNIFIK